MSGIHGVRVMRAETVCFSIGHDIDSLLVLVRDALIGPPEMNGYRNARQTHVVSPLVLRNRVLVCEQQGWVGHFLLAGLGVLLDPLRRGEVCTPMLLLIGYRRNGRK